jgi:hypothetical protein
MSSAVYNEADFAFKTDSELDALQQSVERGCRSNLENLKAGLKVRNASE